MMNAKGSMNKMEIDKTEVKATYWFWLLSEIEHFS